MLMLISRFNQRTITTFVQSSQLNYNLKSAFEIARSAYFTEEKNNRWFKNTFNDDSVRIKKLNWGAYLVIVAETKNRHQALTLSGLYGTAMSADTGIVISDNSRPVGLSGKISLMANCYFPQAGIKPAYIEGQSYQSLPGNAQYIKHSPAKVPDVDADYSRSLKLQQDRLLASDSLCSSIPPVLTQPFNLKTAVFETNSGRLSGYHLKNNIKIISAGTLEIDSSCHLQNVLIIGKTIRFRDGFKGRVHVIASDSIISGKKCVFDYPSSFVVSSGEEDAFLKCVQFSDECIFYGGIIADNNSGKGKVFVKLNASSEVNGLVYSSDYAHVEGKINGNIICNSLLLKTPSAVYENHLLSCEINPGKYAHLIAVPMIFGKSKPLKCCKNL
jgi:hypothetical protein